jgi:LacI family transcriptional regulator
MSCDIITYIKSQLSKDGPIPLYKQILNLLRAYIASGDCPAGARLPTEAELEEELGVSRVTIRQAMYEAVQEGLVVRKAGKGTYVAESPVMLRKQGFVGYVVHHLSNSFNTQILLGVESVLKSTGYHPIFCNSEGDLENEDRLLRSLRTQEVVGFIVQAVYSEATDRVLAYLSKESIPVILLDRELPGVQADLVASDHFEGGRSIVQHLIDQGYQDIVYLARNPLQLSSIAERLRGYRYAMMEAGLTPRPPFIIGGPVELGYNQLLKSLTLHESSVVEAISKFLQSPEHPQALVTMNDAGALLVMEAAEQVNIRIPDDLALAGYDNLDFAASRNLTTIDQNPYQIGVEAARLLLKRLQDGHAEAIRLTLPVKLLIRGSSINPHRSKIKVADLSTSG